MAVHIDDRVAKLNFELTLVKNGQQKINSESEIHVLQTGTMLSAKL